jgi:hypothetical protein
MNLPPSECIWLSHKLREEMTLSFPRHLHNALVPLRFRVLRDSVSGFFGI